MRIIIMASKLLNNKVKTIARVSNPDYIDRSVSVRETVGMNAMVCPELSLAPEINQILSIPEAINVENFVGGRIKMMEFKVGEQNQLVGKKLSELKLELTAKQGSKILNKKLKDVHFPRGAIVSAIVREKEVIIPGGNHTILPEDKVVIFALPSALPAVEELFG